MAEAHDELAPIALTDTAAVVRKGPSATAAWTAATEVGRTTDTTRFGQAEQAERQRRRPSILAI